MKYNNKRVMIEKLGCLTMNNQIIVYLDNMDKDYVLWYRFIILSSKECSISDSQYRSREEANRAGEVQLGEYHENITHRNWFSTCISYLNGIWNMHGDADVSYSV